MRVRVRVGRLLVARRADDLPREIEAAARLGVVRQPHKRRATLTGARAPLLQPLTASISSGSERHGGASCTVACVAAAQGQPCQPQPQKGRGPMPKDGLTLTLTLIQTPTLTLTLTLTRGGGGTVGEHAWGAVVSSACVRQPPPGATKSYSTS